MPQGPIILLFIKAPVKGRVKSRLAKAVGDEAALELYRRFILDIIATLKETGAPFRVFFFPAASSSEVSGLLGGLDARPQQGNDLGKRMEDAFRVVFSEGRRRAILIGSDIPDLPASIITDAYRALEKQNAVIGPARDGGYYLIGFNKSSFHPSIFRGIAWGTNSVFDETMKALQEAALTVWRAPVWGDVDTLDDLRDLVARSKNGTFETSKTMEYIRQLGTSFFLNATQPER